MPAFPIRDSALTVRRTPRGDHGAVVNLKSCEMQHPGAERLLSTVLGRLTPGDVFRYPYLGTLTRQLAAVHDVPPDQLLVTAGSCSAIGLVVDALAEPAGSLVLQEPSFESWRYYAGLRGVPVVRCAGLTGEPVRETHDALLEAMRTAPPSIVAMTNPGNPTGSVTPLSEVDTIAKVAARHGHLLVVDECYAAFAGFSHTALLPGNRNLIVLRSLSKSWAMAGARLACVFADQEIVDYLGRFRPDSVLSTPSVRIATELAGEIGQLREIWRDVAAIRDEFTARVLGDHPRWTALPSGANFVTFATGVPGEGKRLERELAARRIRIRGLDDVDGLDGCLRFSLADRDLMRTVADVLATVTSSARC
ncbi:pyridoxal phosphate-dependent aminotransferase [Lentzea sp.]|uniref:pyridoxal phosphate-dependent aminotransferase n=1 Tax=Lentzea sp. TaxID=56099 RepID=UPI002CE91C90|nr:aminotransferase class I/II-fold pyridoxal phosphate-dependent enzyme [Lentzea sp.]HUQ56466.1 aminotransferase class I/II-fold pyridoxal phosphate-dependent enzyme [Lentzea sp.]